MNNSNNSDLLATVSASIDAFLALSCYDLLASVQSNDITLKNFIPSKDNKHVLSGTQEMFRSLDLSQFDFTLPSKAIKPDRPEKPDPFSGKAKQDYYDALEARDAFDVDPNGGLLNIEIDRIATRLLQHDIIRKFDKLQRICQFVSSHDVSQFDHEEELDLYELPETTRAKILQVYKQAFSASPCLLMTGSTINLLTVDPNCSLDSIAGIDAIIAIKNQNQSASYAFMGRDQLVAVIKAVKNEVNAPSLLKLASRLDSHLGGSKNATTILANLRMCYGFKPSKGKKSTQ